ncbi:pyruvate kinase [Enemella evansiae]|uniref:pyruvate kinase n=1 Tax=Enemella evansiae TaxID=2016499 RepID=UPI000B973369|nr:pyruvate kinase [Enemella evansiae]OYN93063.1 pyruvate kinase [Enemella evansiae]OYO04100.1 pyruvate kinase [Enemella evansiae]
MRRAKIVCTLGPATSGVERLTELVEAGMNVARFNMSHGDHSEHARNLADLRRAASHVGRPVGILADLQGPKIRLGRFAEGQVTLTYGDRFTITTDDIPGDATRCSTTFKGLPGDVSPGDVILIDDGRIQLRAESVTATDVITRVTVGGPVSNNKGINLPGVAVNVPAMTEKDIEDLRWALRNEFDMVALSFVRSAEDVKIVHQVMREEGRRVPVIAKVEKPQAVAAIDEIVDAFDAIMVARGDLGVELPLEDVPLAQKTIITTCRRMAKPVIVATQMLESMISAPRPTRAEASDVANAVLDGADAVMLSGETSVGTYPVVAVQTMARIVTKTEAAGTDRIASIDWDPHTTGGVIAKAAVEVGERLDVKYLVAFTKSGDTARRLARLRASIPILVFTPEDKTRQVLTLVWGVQSFHIPEVDTTDEMVQLVDKALIESARISVGDRVVIVAGSPVGIPGKTNALRVHRIQPPLSETTRSDWDGEI